MNGVDLILAFLLAVYALRGYWRGFIRETFGLLALAAGIAAAFRFAADGAVLLQQYLTLPTSVQAGVAFVLILILVHAVVNLAGVLLDHLAALGSINRLGGVALGAGKGATVLAFVLLFLHLFSISSSVDRHIMSSRIGPPLVNAAANVVRFGLQSASQPDSLNKT
jgi:membrane protein required for colicin V production